MAVRPRYPSAAARQAAYRARKQAAQILAARECTVIQQALRTRALAEQCWELYELIDAYSRDPHRPRQVPEGYSPGSLSGASASFYGMAAARVRRHRRALQRLVQVRDTLESPGGHATRCTRRPRTGGCCAPGTKLGPLQGSEEELLIWGLVWDASDPAWLYPKIKA
jgi:hypothetical protein